MPAENNLTRKVFPPRLPDDLGHVVQQPSPETSGRVSRTNGLLLHNLYAFVPRTNRNRPSHCIVALTSHRGQSRFAIDSKRPR